MSEHPPYETIQATEDFFSRLHPNPKPKNFRTQLGVHCEEFAETLATIEGDDPNTKLLLHYVGEAIKGLSEHLKTSHGELKIKDRVEFLDGLCDTMVTSIGLGQLAGMNVAGAFGEINRSNFSKFGENGEPILDNNLKMVKGPFYTKPDLNNFI